MSFKIQKFNLKSDKVRWVISWDEKSWILKMDDDKECYPIGEKILVFWMLTRHHWILIFRVLEKESKKKEKLEFKEWDLSINPLRLLELITM